MSSLSKKQLGKLSEDCLKFAQILRLMPKFKIENFNRPYEEDSNEQLDLTAKKILQFDPDVISVMDDYENLAYGQEIRRHK